MEEHFIQLSKVMADMDLEEIYMPKAPGDILLTTARVNRPGLQLDGFYDYYEAERVQIIGIVEYQYLSQLSEKDSEEKIKKFMETKPATLIFTTSMNVPETFLYYAKLNGVPILRTNQRTSRFMAAFIAYLDEQLAPRITRHGVLVEVYGEGVLLIGDSGIGKSETAMELLKRGHRLIADDAVEIRRVSEKSLIGNAPESIRHYMELRGVGIVDVRRLFGMSAIKESTEINLIIELENWDKNKTYDRFGIEDQTKEVLGINVPSITIPVCPGRNLSIIIEVAAMNHRLKTLGYNTAKEFNDKLMKNSGLEF